MNVQKTISWAEKIKYLLKNLEATTLELSWFIGCSSRSLENYLEGNVPSKKIQLVIDRKYREVIKNGYQPISREHSTSKYGATSDEVGRKIKQIRRTKNLTQAELAYSVGVRPVTVSNWEAGKVYPQIGKTWRRIQDVLGIEYADLFELGKNTSVVC